MEKADGQPDQDWVWAQMRYCPYWPARVVETPPMLAPAPAKKICVLFFGTKQYGFVSSDRIVNYSENREKFIKKGKGNDFRNAVKQMDEYLSDKVKFSSNACVKPQNVKVKTERNVELGLGIVKTEKAVAKPVQNDTASTVTSWTNEKQVLIDKIKELKEENQVITQKFNDKLSELSTMKKGNQMLEDRLKQKQKIFSSNVCELQMQLAKSKETVESNKKEITSLKRENQLLILQANQLKTSLVDASEPKENEDDIYDVDVLLDDKLVSERHYLVRWKGFDQSHDSWERESNLSCPSILKKYKQSKKKH